MLRLNVMLRTALTRPAVQVHTLASSAGVLSNPAAAPSRLPRPGVDEGVMVEEDVEEEVCVDVAVCETLGVPVCVELAVPVCELLGVAVCVELAVPVCVWLPVPVCEELGVAVCEGLAVPVWLLLGVPLEVEAAVALAVEAAVLEGVGSAETAASA